jgi:hypothetical protein
MRPPLAIPAIPRRYFALLAVLALAAPSPARSAATSAPQPIPPAARPMPPPAAIDVESEPILRAMVAAMGGQEAWDRLPCFRFDFVYIRDGKEVSRTRHWWDKRTGRARVEATDDQGRHVATIFNLQDRRGLAFVDGIGEGDPKRVAELTQEGYERWVNDTYWVMMPFKLRDPGVRVRYARNEKTLETVYDVLELSFVAGTGLTSDDRYWLYVNRRTRMIDRWEYVLTGQSPPPAGASWEAWSQVGPVKLSLQRRFQGRSSMLRFENVSTPASFDETVFTYSSVSK